MNQELLDSLKSKEILKNEKLINELRVYDKEREIDDDPRQVKKRHEITLWMYERS
jgi:hypothetical protein